MARGIAGSFKLAKRTNGQETVGCLTSLTILANNFLSVSLVLIYQSRSSP